MPSPSVLFLGGTGIISSACVQEALAAGFEVTVVNRGTTLHRPLPKAVEQLTADVRDTDALDRALGAREFDVVADFLSFSPDHVRAHIDRWVGRTGQYVFTSSASAYQTPPERIPVTESTPLRNPVWQYSRDKIACEELLVAAHRNDAFPMTIVRPSHTYDRASLPFHGGWTAVDRMRRGRPIVVHGDGTSLWTLTHSSDFAKAYLGLLGEARAVGDAFHITSDEHVTWDQITRTVAHAAGTKADIVHVASDAIASIDPIWGDSLLGDKAHSMTFDNTKIKRLVPGWQATVPFTEGARQIVEWHDAEPGRRHVEPVVDAIHDRLIERFGARG